MVGHYETPYGSAKGDVPPGTYVVGVWWVGAGAPSGGAPGSAFVLKLYLP